MVDNCLFLTKKIMNIILLITSHERTLTIVLRRKRAINPKFNS